MKTAALTTIVSLVALNAGVAAIVFPDEAVIAQIPIEETHEADFQKSGWHLPSFQDVTDKLKHPFEHCSGKVVLSPFDKLIVKAERHLEDFDKDGQLGNDDEGFLSRFDANAWVEEGLKEENGDGFVEDDMDVESWSHEEPPHEGHPPGPPPPPPHHEYPPGLPHGPPSGPPPHDGHPPGPPPHHGPPGHPPPHKKPGKKHPPFHRHHPHKFNLTIYELLTKSNYTKNFTALINEDKDLVALLNSTKANHTIFVPTDKAFKKIPKNIKPPKELIKSVLLYHVLPGVFPSFKLVFWHTAPTLLEGTQLGNNSQRVLVDFLGPFRGLTVNLRSKVILPNLIATNGILHATNRILLPPPPAAVILNAVPTAFSTLTLGLERSGVSELLNYTEHPHAGGTLFAPTNRAFALLGPKVNAFLFSPFGKKFLRALLKYHIVPDKTVYSTAFYNGSASSSGSDLFEFMSMVTDEVEELNEKPHKPSMWERMFGERKGKKHHCGKAKKRHSNHDDQISEDRHHHHEDQHDHDGDVSKSRFPFLDGILGKWPKKPHHHPNWTHPHSHPNWSHPHHPHPHVKIFKLPTLLSNHSVPIAIIKFGPFVKFKVNRFATVVVKDGLAKDGVIQVVNRVLIPPRPKKKEDEKTMEFNWDNEEVEEYGPEGMSLEEFKERMAPYVEEDEQTAEAEQRPVIEDGSKLEF